MSFYDFHPCRLTEKPFTSAFELDEVVLKPFSMKGRADFEPNAAVLAVDDAGFVQGREESPVFILGKDAQPIQHHFQGGFRRRRDIGRRRSRNPGVRCFGHRVGG